MTQAIVSTMVHEAVAVEASREEVEEDVPSGTAVDDASDEDDSPGM